jgi:hypothetical protein
MDTLALIPGGCACGDVKYEIRGAPIELVHCDCASCRRASGGEPVTLLLVDRQDFKWLRGQNRVVTARVTLKNRGAEDEESSDANEFTSTCRRCGSDLPRVHQYLPVVLVPTTSLDGDARAIASRPEASNLQV